MYVSQAEAPAEAGGNLELVCRPRGGLTRSLAWRLNESDRIVWTAAELRYHGGRRRRTRARVVNASLPATSLSSTVYGIEHFLLCRRARPIDTHVHTGMGVPSSVPVSIITPVTIHHCLPLLHSMRLVCPVSSMRHNVLTCR